MLWRQFIAAAIVWVVPAAASAQTFGVAARAGTLGFGGEAAFQINDNIALRGGVGTFPFSYTGEVTDANYTITPPSRMLNAGIDLYPGWLDFRIGGGVLLIGDETEFEAEIAESIVVGGQTYPQDQIESIIGELDHGSAAPYANIGLGRHTGAGIGIFADFGAAFLSEQNVTLDATGPGANDPQFRARLEEERADIETDVRKYIKVLPIISLGIRYGF